MRPNTEPPAPGGEREREAPRRRASSQSQDGTDAGLEPSEGQNGGHDDSRSPTDDGRSGQLQAGRSICSLSDDDVAERLAEWRRLREQALHIERARGIDRRDEADNGEGTSTQGSVGEPSGVVMTFHPSEAEHIERVIAAEGVCCPSIDFALVSTVVSCTLAITPGSMDDTDGAQSTIVDLLSGAPWASCNPQRSNNG